MTGFSVTMLGCGGSTGSPQIGGPDGQGDWGELDPAEPRNRRSRPSIVIEAAGCRLLVDTGPDLRAQLTACRVPRIDAVLYTHAHADHIAGLDEIRVLNRISGKPMPCYAEEAVWAELRARFNYVFRPWNGEGFFRPVLEPHVISPGETLDIVGLSIEIFGQDHGFIRSLGLRVGNFAYCTDVLRLEEDALAQLTGLEVLIVDCFVRAGFNPTHANLEQALRWAEALKPGRTILTHMGHTMDYGWLRANLPAGVEPGYDGLVLGFSD